MANYGLFGGLGQALGILGQGIVERKKERREMEMQQRAAQDLNEYLKTGVIRPGLLQIPGMANSIIDKLHPKSMGTPEWIERPPSSGVGPAQLLKDIPRPGDQPYEKPGAPKSDTSITPYDDFRAQYTSPEGRVDYPSLTKAWTQSQVDIYGAKKSIDAAHRPDKSERVEFVGEGGKVKYGFFKTDPSTNKTTFEETAVTPPVPAASQRISATDRQYLTEMEGLEKVIGDIRSNFNENYVGFFQGRIGGIESKTSGNTKQEASFRQAVSSLKNQLLKSRSGAAVTENEFERILTELPTENDPTENFLQKLRQTEENIKLLKQTRSRLQGGANTGRGGKMTRDQFIQDFQNEEGRSPTEAELEQLRQMGEWE